MKLMTASDLARMLNLTVRSVYRLQSGGEIPPSFKISSGTSRWDAGEIEEFLQDQKNRDRFQVKSAD